MSGEPRGINREQLLKNRILSTFRAMCVGTEDYNYVISDLKDMDISLEDFEKFLRRVSKRSPEWFEHFQYKRRTKKFLNIYREYYNVEPPAWILDIFKDVEDV